MVCGLCHSIDSAASHTLQKFRFEALLVSAGRSHGYRSSVPCVVLYNRRRAKDRSLQALQRAGGLLSYCYPSLRSDVPYRAHSHQQRLRSVFPQRQHQGGHTGPDRKSCHSFSFLSCRNGRRRTGAVSRDRRRKCSLDGRYQRISQA